MFNPALESIAPVATGITADKLFVKVGTRIKQVDTANIIYAEASGNYIGIVMDGGEVIHTKQPISRFDSRLSNLSFIRVHRSYIVNIKCIKEIRTGQNGYELTLSNGIQIISGTTYKKRIRAQLLTNLRPDHKPELNKLTGSNVVDFHAVSGAQAKYHKLSRNARIRPCAPGDEYALAFLGKITFMETYAGAFMEEDMLAHCVNHDSPATYLAWLKNSKARIWVVETEMCNAPVGYLVVAPPTLPFADLRKDDLEIHRIYLLKHFQGSGLGKSLITKAMQYVKQNGFKRVLLGDYKHNDRSIDFYKRVGFLPMGEYLCRSGENDYSDIVFSLEI